MKKIKKIPRFKNEGEEIEFWAKHDTTDYVDKSSLRKVRFPHLKLSSRVIPIRLPIGLYERLKIVANKKDVPYQSLMKVYLDERVKKELTDV